MKKIFIPLVYCTLISGFWACEQLDDERTPAVAVNINLSNQGIWTTYGVHAFGEYDYFIFTSTLRSPEGFAYSYDSATGYGGVLLIGGQNGFTGATMPLAYDLSCPVENQPDIRVYVDDETWDAICPVCGSHYNVVEANGAPISGLALSMKYGLTPYNCYPTTTGGYIIGR